MFHNLSSSLKIQQYTSSTFNKQAGFLLPVALFIIVVLGGMALIVSKKISQSASSYVTAGLSTQAFYGAESGAQAGLHELFFVDDDRQLVDGRCAAMAISQPLFGDGLRHCSVTVSCTCNYENGNSCDDNNSANYLGLTGVSNSFYTLNARAECGVEPTIAHHLIEVGASL
jgi:MSHA biogenesis protein MshP